MPAPSRTLTIQEAESLVRDASFGQITPGRVGVEIELFARDTTGRQPSVDELDAVLQPLGLPCGSRISFEPGGQVELSSSPMCTAREASDALSEDLLSVRSALARVGIELYAAGMEPDRAPMRVTNHPRYAAMEAFFDTRGREGRRMMSTTAAVQINVDRGPDPDVAARITFLSALGPVLVAAFANSPLAEGRPTGWRSGRMAAWAAIDPSRTAPVEFRPDPAAAWTAYALQASVMLVADGASGFVAMERPLTFAQWVAQGHPLGYPTADDLAYHLTTLFPPVRPRGWLELRMVDMLDDPWWRVPVAIVSTLLCDQEARRRTERALEPVAGLWVEAARGGLQHPDLRAAADACFGAVLSSMRGACLADADADLVAGYRDRYVRRGRTPADETLARWVGSRAHRPSLEAM